MRKLVLAAGLIGALVIASPALAATSPTVSPAAVTNIGAGGAILHGTVNPNGLATTYQFSYGLTSALGQFSPASPASAGLGTKPVPESTKLTGLLPDTTYFYVLTARNSGGTSSTPIETFKTTGNPIPTVTTGPAANVSRYAATLVGTINPNNQATSYYFQYGLSSAYGLQTAVSSVPAGIAPVTVTAALPGIAPGTAFHYRLVASHGGVTTNYGGDVTFTTPPWPRPHTQLSLRARLLTATFGQNRIVVGGRIRLPRSTPAALGCNGVVAIAYYAYGRRVANARVALAPNCTYGTVVRIRRPAGTPIVVKASYRGDAYLAPAGVKPAVVTLL